MLQCWGKNCKISQSTALVTPYLPAVVETLDSRSVSPRLSAISSLAWSRSGVQPLLEHLGEHGEHVAGRQQALVVQHVHVDPGDKTAANQGRGCTHVWRQCGLKCLAPSRTTANFNQLFEVSDGISCTRACSLSCPGGLKRGHSGYSAGRARDFCFDPTNAWFQTLN